MAIRYNPKDYMACGESDNKEFGCFGCAFQITSKCPQWVKCHDSKTRTVYKELKKVTQNDINNIATVIMNERSAVSTNFGSKVSVESSNMSKSIKANLLSLLEDDSDKRMEIVRTLDAEVQKVIDYQLSKGN